MRARHFLLNIYAPSVAKINNEKKSKQILIIGEFYNFKPTVQHTESLSHKTHLRVFTTNITKSIVSTYVLAKGRRGTQVRLSDKASLNRNRILATPSSTVSTNTIEAGQGTHRENYFSPLAAI